MGWLLDPMTVVLTMLVVSLFLAFIRLVWGPSLPDRVVALDLIVIIVLSIIGVFVVFTDQPVFLDAAIILALLGFVGTIAFARYLERGGQDE